jgi:hypothetical protein
VAPDTWRIKASSHGELVAQADILSQTELCPLLHLTNNTPYFLSLKTLLPLFVNYELPLRPEDESSSNTTTTKNKRILVRVSDQQLLGMPVQPGLSSEFLAHMYAHQLRPLSLLKFHTSLLHS